jgi:hypothetical protein
VIQLVSKNNETLRNDDHLRTSPKGSIPIKNILKCLTDVGFGTIEMVEDRIKLIQKIMLRRNNFKKYRSLRAKRSNAAMDHAFTGKAAIFYGTDYF